MSKEQTPITFKGFKKRGELCEFCGEPTTIASRNKHKRGVVCSCDWQDRKAEQYAQLREKKAVLEALEREFTEVVIFDSGELTKGIDYFKTEVKPNYGLERLN